MVKSFQYDPVTPFIAEIFQAFVIQAGGLQVNYITSAPKISWFKWNLAALRATHWLRHGRFGATGREIPN